MNLKKLVACNLLLFSLCTNAGYSADAFETSSGTKKSWTSWVGSACETFALSAVAVISPESALAIAVDKAVNSGGLKGALTLAGNMAFASMDPVSAGTQHLSKIVCDVLNRFNKLSTGEKIFVGGVIALSAANVVKAATLSAPTNPQRHYMDDPRSDIQICFEQTFGGYDVQHGHSIGALCTQTTFYDQNSKLCVHTITCTDLNSYNPETQMANIFGHTFGFPPISPFRIEMNINDGKLSLLMGQDCTSLQNALPKGWIAAPYESSVGLLCSVMHQNGTASSTASSVVIPPVMHRSGRSLFNFKEINFAEELNFYGFHFNPFGTCGGATGPEPCNAHMMRKPYGGRIPKKEENWGIYFSKEPQLVIEIPGLSLADFSKILPHGINPIPAIDGGTAYPSLEADPHWRAVSGRKVNTDEL